jgi:predicted alpha/beta superfamily hydrolase
MEVIIEVSTEVDTEAGMEVGTDANSANGAGQHGWAQVLDGVRTHWAPYPVEAWQEALVSGQLLGSLVKSPQLGNERTVLVYLPASYNAGERRYPVVYLQDGQNMFDPATAFGGKTWQVGETLTKLAGEGIEAIVVAPYNMEKQRIEEYNPFAQWRNGRGTAYVEFIADTLKPIIDHDFRTLADTTHTVIGGSSMGGLISLCAYCMRRDVFGSAIVMSPSLWVANGAAYRVAHDKLHPGGKLYVDNGTRESSAQPLVAIAVEKGYRQGGDLLYVQGRGERHTETAWARRLPDALRFVLSHGDRR